MNLIDHVASALPGKDDVPGNKISNEELINALGEENVGGLNPEKFEIVFGIRSRRFMSKISPATGKPQNPERIDEVRMAATATRKIFRQTDITEEGIDGLFYVTATQNPYFNEAYQRLCRQIELSNLSFGNEMTVGCDGVGVALVQAERILRGSQMNNTLIVASHGPSRHINAELYAENDQHY